MDSRKELEQALAKERELRRKAERDLVALQEQFAARDDEIGESFRYAAERAGDIVLRTDLERRITYASPAAKTLLGYNPADVIGRQTLEFFVDPLEARRAADAHDALLRHGGTDRVEGLVQAADGRRVPIEAVISAVPSDDDATVREVVVIVRDVTARKEAERFRRLMEVTVERAGDAVFWTDADARLLYANESACRQLGYSFEQLTQMYAFDIDPTLDPQRWKLRWEELKQSGTFIVESRHRSSGGHVYPVEIHLNAVPFEGEHYCAAVVRNISRRKAAETALEAARDRTEALNRQLTAILDAAVEVGIVAADTGGTIQIFNRGAERLFGWSAEEMIGQQSPMVLVDPDHLAESQAEAERELGRRVSPFESTCIHAEPGKPDRREWWMRRKDGTKMLMDIAVSILVNEAGEPNGFLGVAIDITRRHHSQQQLQRSERAMRSLYEITSATSGRFEDQAQQVLELGRVHFGLEVAIISEITGDEFHIKQLAAPESLGLAPDMVLPLRETYCERTIRTSEPVSFVHAGQSEWRSHPAYLQTQLEAYLGAVIQVRGRPYGTLLFAGSVPRDAPFSEFDVQLIKLMAQWVSVELDRKAAQADLERFTTDLLKTKQDLEQRTRQLEQAREEAEAANEAKSVFLANMSHEIRTPMAAILGYADLLNRDEIAPDRQAEWTSHIHKNADYLLSLVNGILDLSKIEAGRFDMHKETCDLPALIAEVDSLMRPRAIDKLLAFQARYESAVPRTIRTDPLRFKQVLVNLTSNAVKFTDRGGVSIHVSFDPPTSEATIGRLRVTVRDTGGGIPPEKLADIFSPFSQVTSTPGRRAGGSGLGLTICRRLTEILEGRITVDSTPGEGSRFTVELDLEADATGPLVEPEPASAATTSGPAVEANLTGLRVLVVEDNPDNQRIVEYLLGERGAEVSLAADGEEGVATVLAAQRRGEPFDAVLMDVQMPVKDGLEAARELRAAGIPTPIIALTAYAMADDEQRCLEAGCDRYIRKPIAPAELVAAVAESLPPARRASLPSRPSAAVGREGASIVSSLAEEPGFSPLLEEYIGEFPQRRTEITEAIEAGDVEKLRLIVHRLKGTAANYGFPQISRQAATCEAAMTGGVVNQQARRQASLLLDLLTRAAPTGDASRNER